MTDRDLLDLATHFLVVPREKEITRGVFEVTVELRETVSGHAKWAIVDVNRHLNRDGVWEDEPPSPCSAEFLERCRWNDPKEAISFVREHMQKYPDGIKDDRTDAAPMEEREPSDQSASEALGPGRPEDVGAEADYILAC